MPRTATHPVYLLHLIADHVQFERRAIAANPF